MKHSVINRKIFFAYWSVCVCFLLYYLLVKHYVNYVQIYDYKM